MSESHCDCLIHTTTKQLHKLTRQKLACIYTVYIWSHTLQGMWPDPVQWKNTKCKSHQDVRQTYSPRTEEYQLTHTEAVQYRLHLRGSKLKNLYMLFAHSNTSFTFSYTPPLYAHPEQSWKVNWDWLLNLGISMDCAGRWWRHHPWGCLRKGWMLCLRTWFSG